MEYDILTKRQLIGNILQQPDTLKKYKLFAEYEKKLGECVIFLFDEAHSSFDRTFQNQRIGQCEIVGLSDYTKTWILDRRSLNERAVFACGKAIDFDLNVLSYLNDFMQRKRMGIDRKAFLEYLNYLKKYQFRCEISTALMERVCTPVDRASLSQRILSFVRFDSVDVIDEETPCAYLPPEKYDWAKELDEQTKGMARVGNLNEGIFNVLYCCVLKAALIKAEGGTVGEKRKELLRYSLDTLHCYMENELVLLALYLKDDNRTSRVFKKLRPGPELLKNAANVTWDLFHLRLLEEIMLRDNTPNRGPVILPYFATADHGIVDVLELNPLRALAIFDGRILPFHKMNIEEVCTEQALLNQIRNGSAKRMNEIRQMDILCIRQQLEQQVRKRLM